MSSLDPRVAITIAVTLVMPGTMFAILRYDLISVQTGKVEELRHSFVTSAEQDLLQLDDQLLTEPVPDSESLPSTSKVTRLPERRLGRGPQILGTVDRQAKTGDIFTVAGDPFINVTQPAQKPNTQAHSSQPGNQTPVENLSKAQPGIHAIEKRSCGYRISTSINVAEAGDCANDMGIKVIWLTGQPNSEPGRCADTAIPQTAASSATVSRNCTSK